MNVTGQELIEWAILPLRQTITVRDAILYAYSVGYGTEPTDPDHLMALYERDLRSVPTMANVIAQAGPWLKGAGVDWSRVVHAEHRLVLHREIPIGVELESCVRTVSVVDRGVGRGAFVSFERAIGDPATGEPVATIVMTAACGGDGGCGSAGTAPERLPAPPERAPDGAFELPIPVGAAALYRLNGDLNPLHIDPAFAASGGFPKPILHGLCTFGQAGYAIARLTSLKEGFAMRAMAARFTAPFFPGETLRTEIWRSGRTVQFRCRAVERDKVVLDYGIAELG